MNDSHPHPHSDPVEAFRRWGGQSSAASREPLPLRQKLILMNLTLQVVFLGWSVGGLHVWSVLTLCVLNTLGFLWLFVPLGQQNARLESPRGPVYYGKQLLKWPFFWCGLLFLAYVGVQNLNPAWQYTLSADGTQWWMTQIPHNARLPTGIIAPFAQMNGWRALMIFASALLLVCTVWCGVHRREHLIYLLWVSVLSTTIMVVVGLVQRFTQAPGILWLIENVPNYYFGTFSYKNHAGAFIGLNIAIALSLAMYHFRRSRRRSVQSSPHFFMIVTALVMATGLFYTDSRGSMVIIAAVLIGSCILFIFECLSSRPGHGSLWFGLILTTVCLGFGWFLFSFLNVENIEQRLNIVLDDLRQLEEGTTEDFSQSAKQRYYIYSATWEMVQDNPWWGWGAGAYRYYFPVYQQKYPQIYYWEVPRWRTNEKTKAREKFMQRRYWGVEHAHNDWLQYPAEFGYVGCGIGLLGILSLLVSGLRKWRRVRLWMLVGILGCVGTAAHALIDFVLQSPSILLLWILVPVIIVKYLHLSDRIMERQRERQQAEEEAPPLRLNLRAEAEDEDLAAK